MKNELIEYEKKLRTVIHEHCNKHGCKNCELEYEDGCSATDLQGKINDIMFGV